MATANKTEKQISIFTHLGQSLTDVWDKRETFFWMLLFSMILWYVKDVIYIIQLAKEFGLEKAELLDITNFGQVFEEMKNSAHEKSITVNFSTGIYGIVSVYIMSAISYLLYTSVLNDRKATGFFDGYFNSLKPFGIFLWYYVFIIGFAILMGMDVLASIGLGSVSDSSVLGVVLGAVIFLVVLWFAAHLVFVTPSIAIGKGMKSIGYSWGLTRGRIWKVIVLAFGLACIGILSSIVSNVVIHGVFNFIIHHVDTLFGEILFFVQMAVSVFFQAFVLIWSTVFLARVMQAFEN